MSCLTPSKDVSRGKVWCRSRQPLPVSVLLNLELRTNKKWQVTISNDLLTKPANEEEVELAGGVGQPGGGEDAVVGRGGVDHLLQALHHLRDHVCLCCCKTKVKTSPLPAMYQASEPPLAQPASLASPRWASRTVGSPTSSSQLFHGTWSESCPALTD